VALLAGLTTRAVSHFPTETTSSSADIKPASTAVIRKRSLVREPVNADSLSARLTSNRERGVSEKHRELKVNKNFEQHYLTVSTTIPIIGVVK